MLIAYLILAAWFFAADLLAGWVAGVKCRPIAAALLAMVWPLSVAFALVASAILIRHHRDSPTPPDPGHER